MDGETEDVEAGPGMTFDEAQAFLRKWEKKIKADLTSDAAELKIRCTSEKLILFEKKLEFYQSILVPYIGSSERLIKEEADLMRDFSQAKCGIEDPTQQAGKTNVTEIQKIQGTLMKMGMKLKGVKVEQDKMAKQIQELRGTLSEIYGSEATQKSDNEIKWELEEQRRLKEEERVRQEEIAKKQHEEDVKRKYEEGVRKQEEEKKRKEEEAVRLAEEKKWLQEQKEREEEEMLQQKRLERQLQRQEEVRKMQEEENIQTEQEKIRREKIVKIQKDIEASKAKEAAEEIQKKKDKEAREKEEDRMRRNSKIFPDPYDTDNKKALNTVWKQLHD